MADNAQGPNWPQDAGPSVYSPATPAIDFANMPGLGFGGYSGASIPLTEKNFEEINTYNNREKTKTDTIEKLTKNIIDQGTMSKWSTGSGLSKEQAARYMAEKLYNDGGITSLKDFGKIPIKETVDVVKGSDGTLGYTTQGSYQTEGGDGYYTTTYDEFVPLTAAEQAQVKDGKLVRDTGQIGYGNKSTGQVIPVNYDRAKQGDWGGTFAGDSSSGYGVQFDAQGNPYFYTHYDTVDPFGGLSPLIGLAAAIFAPELLPSLGAMAAPTVSAVMGLISGQDPTKILTNAALSYAGSQIGSSVSSGLTDTLGSTGANILGNVAKQEIASGGKLDPVQALISGGLSAGTNAVLGEIPGFTDMSKAAQASLTNLVANTLKTGDLDPTKAVNAAINAGMSFANQSGPSSSDMIEGYFAPGGEGYIAPEEPVEQPYTPTTDYSIGANYNLFSDSTAAPSLEDMGGGQGFQVAPVDENQNVGYEPVDYSLNTSTPFEGLQMPTVPNIDSMGGGQGFTVPVAGGTFTESGFIPTGTAPDLGDPNSFINKPAPGGDVSAAVKAATDKAAMDRAAATKAAADKAASDKAAADKAAADKAAAEKAARDKAANDAFNQLKAQAQAQQNQQDALMKMMSSNNDVAHIKSNTNLFGAIPGMEPPASSAQQQPDPVAALQGMDQQYAIGGHVDDFDVDALLHILRS